MTLSDRIALLNNGALEQVASPREIYAHPVTSYTAQFIGQTNLLRAKVYQGIAASGALRWPCNSPDGAVLFSLRPERIQLGSGDGAAADVVRFRGREQQQTFAGSEEQLEVECSGQVFRVRIPARGVLTGEQEFWFDPADAVPVAG